MIQEADILLGSVEPTAVAALVALLVTSEVVINKVAFGSEHNSFHR